MIKSLRKYNRLLLSVSVTVGLGQRTEKICKTVGSLLVIHEWTQVHLFLCHLRLSCIRTWCLFCLEYNVNDS